MNLLRPIYLDKNELPFLPPREVLKEAKKSIDRLNRYTPQEKVDKLVSLLANYAHISKESLILRPASDILIKELIFLLSKNRKIIIADPTFIIIQNATQSTTSSVLKVKLSAPKFKFPSSFIVTELDEPTLVFLDNPNNPTGKLIITKSEVKSLLANENLILLVDEAYFEFSNWTVASLVNKYPNLGVLRTLSKSFGLAGVGLGYLIAGESIREKLENLDVMLPYPSVMSSIAALNHQEYFQQKIRNLNAEKKRVKNEIEKLEITVYSSNANFFLLKTEIPHIAHKLNEVGIYVYDASHYLSPGYIRVSIGTKDENQEFLKGLSRILNK